MQLVVFILVIALVYAAKVAAVAAKHDELVQNSTAFSWMSPRPQDEATAASWTQEQPAKASEPRVALGTSPVMRHVGA